MLITLMVTFGLSVVIENGLLQFFTANSRAIGTGLALVSGSFRIGSQIQIGYLLVVIFAVAVVVLLGLQYFLSASRYGRLIRGLVAIVVALFARRGLWGLVDEHLNVRLFPVGYWLRRSGESPRGRPVPARSGVASMLASRAARRPAKREDR